MIFILIGIASAIIVIYHDHWKVVQTQRYVEEIKREIIDMRDWGNDIDWSGLQVGAEIVGDENNEFDCELLDGEIDGEWFDE